MAKTKQDTRKVLYHGYFNGDNVGEADGFFEIVGNKLKLVTCWSMNDAHWRDEYMSGLLRWAGVELKDLPKNRFKEAEKLVEECWGL